MTTAGKESLLSHGYLLKKTPLLKLEEEAPIIVGGFGGSGTRVPVLYLLALGANMVYDPVYVYPRGPGGKPIYETMVEFGFKWAKDHLYYKLDEEHMAGVIATTVEDRVEKYGRPWGWKMPGMIFLTEPLHKAIPNMKFVHITRDPRDVAFDAMTTWVHMFARADNTAPIKAPEQVITKEYFKLWNKGNLEAYEYGTKHLGENYLHIRLEDLVPRNEAAREKLANFIGVKNVVMNNKFWKEIVQAYKIGTRIKDRQTPDFLKPALEGFGYEL